MRSALEASELGALLCFDVNNVRYTTSTQIGEWVRDKVCRYSLLTRTEEPVLWDFGSAAKHHRLYAPWLETENSRAGMLGLRGSVAPDAGLMDSAAREIKAMLDAAGVGNEPVGVDIAEVPMIFALQRAGIEVRDGQRVPKIPLAKYRHVKPSGAGMDCNCGPKQLNLFPKVIQAGIPDEYTLATRSYLRSFQPHIQRFTKN